MKIELEEPYRSKWRFGYLRVSSEGRRILDLYNSDQDRTTISYARYLYGVKLGYEVPSEYEVDHSDENRLNDDVNNLQLLTGVENRLKSHESNAFFTKDIALLCPNCNGEFFVLASELRFRQSRNQEMFCSRNCSGQYVYENIHKPIGGYSLTEADIDRIREYRSAGLSSYKISELTGFARNTIMKYW